MAVDNELFTAFVAARYRSLVRTAYLLVGDRGHAEDLVQHALIRTYGAWGRLDDPANAEAYTRKTLVRATGRSFSSPDVLEAKALAVRYLWSGHSSSHETVPGQPDPCPDPGRLTFFKQGLGLADLAGYDYSPFGSAQVGGSYLVASLGIMWNCPSVIGPNSVRKVVHGVLGPCFRETEANLINPNPFNIVDPGIFPATIDTPGESSKYMRWPISRMMGENESEAGQQLWSRTVAHLLGHALGLSSDAAVGNEPAPAGRKQSSHHSALTALAPDTYTTWTGLDLAAGNRSGPRSTESYPNYDQLGNYSASLSDPDNDGVLEANDNCPGVYNPDQSNDDNGRFHLGHNTAEFGDACDPDIDGDGQRNVTPGVGGTTSSQPALRTRSTTTRTTAMAASPTADGLDPMPYDTNNGQRRRCRRRRRRSPRHQ
ncbi:MAG: sigma factor [Mycobacteriales bacterium]